MHAQEWMRKPTKVSRLEEKVLIHLKPRAISQVCFHPYEQNLLYTAAQQPNRMTKIECWDLINVETSLNSFKNFEKERNYKNTVSSMCLMNEFYSPILAVGNRDSTIRLWKDVHCSGQQKLVTSFRALPLSKRSNGIKIRWNKDTGQFVAAGSYPAGSHHPYPCEGAVRIWDVRKEQVVQEYRLRDVATSVSGLPFDPNLSIVGLRNGNIVLLDPRQKNPIVVEHLHSSSIVKVCPHKNFVLISASKDGRICFSDPRMIASKGAPALQTFQLDLQCSTMDAFDAHPYAPLLAAKNRDEREGDYVSLFEITAAYDVKKLPSIRYHRGFLGQRIGQVSCLQFHPHFCILAVGAGELISIHDGKVRKDSRSMKSTKI